MYSLVLMAALTTPATTLDCNKSKCSGCTGASYASCTGGCYGSRCYGSCSGSCSGSCWGSRYSNCSGSCSGYYSSCSGCTGSCSGSAYYYTGSCWGGHSCYGCSGSSGGTCSGTTSYNAAYPPSYDYQQAPKTEMPKPTTFNTSSPAPAVVSITLPADAKLYVDGQLTKTMDKSVRTFATPDLENGQEYRYVMKAEVLRDGIVQSETKTVIVKAGADIREEFATLNDVKTASNR